MVETSLPMSCIVCRKKLEVLWADQNPTQCFEAVMFNASGNYGSTVYDPSLSNSLFGSRELLVVNVCDACLLALAADQLIYVQREVREVPVVDHGVWVPDLYEGDVDEN